MGFEPAIAIERDSGLQFALVRNQRVPAEPQRKGICPGCLQPVTAKCGTRRIWHWSHQADGNCDPWWERETEWHRAWKNKYPPDWQECVKQDQQSGEKHIADICTSRHLVIEFQHSHIDPQERLSREKFYRNMVWVVDGTRLKRDYGRFHDSKSTFMTEVRKGVFLVELPQKCFPSNWLDSTVPVIFDFRGGPQSAATDQDTEFLWCLLPGRAEGHAVVIATSYAGFVMRSSTRSLLLRDKDIVRWFEVQLRQKRGKDLHEMVAEIETNMQLQRQHEELKQRTRHINPDLFHRKH